MCYDLAKAQGTVSVLVTDQAIAEAQALLWRSLRQLVEPAGATALAALTSGAYVPEPGERVAVLVCGAKSACFRIATVSRTASASSTPLA